MSETDVVVLPSPAFVGVIAVTQTSFASGVAASRSSTDRPNLGLVIAVQLDLVAFEAHVGRDVRDRPELRGLGDLEARQHAGIIPSPKPRDTMKQR